jgi:choline dehydrogenase-like flavoprotein
MAADEYDFVIIGGGTSGLVVANRLSEDPNVQVLVLEAGENHVNDPRVMIPALCMSLQGSEADWNFETTPQVWCYLPHLDVYLPTLLAGQSEG